MAETIDLDDVSAGDNQADKVTFVARGDRIALELCGFRRYMQAELSPLEALQVATELIVRAHNLLRRKREEQRPP